MADDGAGSGSTTVPASPATASRMLSRLVITARVPAALHEPAGGVDLGPHGAAGEVALGGVACAARSR